MANPRESDAGGGWDPMASDHIRRRGEGQARHRSSRGALRTCRGGADERRGRHAAGGEGGNRDHTKFEIRIEPACNLPSILPIVNVLKTQCSLRFDVGGASSGDGTCLQWASGRWVAVRSRFFRMREHGSATGGAARAAHCPPAARSLLAKNVRPQGTAEGWAAESHIQAAHDCPSPPLAVRPCPRFAAGAPQLLLPTHRSLGAHPAARRPGAQKDGAHAY